jgi:hypothetical protein
MADKNIIIGHVIDVTGMIGVLSGTVLFTFGVVLLLFRRGFGFKSLTSGWPLPSVRCALV